MIKLNVKISAESVATGSIVISLLVTLLVFTFFGWLGYAYFNPNTASGRFLIKVLSKMFKNEIWLLIINPWTMNTYQFYWSMFRCYMHILAILFSSKSLDTIVKLNLSLLSISIMISISHLPHQTTINFLSAV